VTSEQNVHGCQSTSFSHTTPLYNLLSLFNVYNTYLKSGLRSPISLISSSLFPSTQ
jgi:hypothetical protein